MPPPTEPPAAGPEARTVAGLTLSEQVTLLTGADLWSLPALPGIGLAPLVCSDGPAGVRGTAWDERDPSLLIPCPTALAATWDPALVQRAGALLGGEAAARGVHVLLAPTINLLRTPYGGRGFECFGEDPLLSGRLAAAYVEGVQAAGVAATPKHFVANDSETDRRGVSVEVDPRTLHEVYLRPFADALAAGAWAVMAAYNAVGGQAMTEHHALLTGVLRDRWGFDGVVMSDWHAALTTEPTILAGLDLVMPGPDGPWGAALCAAVEQRRVPAGAVTAAATRVLRLAARTGAWQGGPASTEHAAPQPPAPVTPEAPATHPAPATPQAATTHPAPATPEAAEGLLTTLAAAGTTLLSNDGVLPLTPDRLQRVALIGPNAVALTTQGGGSAQVIPARTPDLPAALRTALGADTDLTVAEGVAPEGALPALDPAHCSDPDGTGRGLRFETRDAAGGLLFSVVRTHSDLPLAHGGAFADPSGAATLVLRTMWTPRSDGTHTLAVAGVGRYRLTVDGVVHDLTLEAGDVDDAEALLHPPEARLPLPARAGQPVSLVLEQDLHDATFPAVRLRLAEPRPPATDLFDAAVAAAADADAAIVVVGTGPQHEREGADRAELSLPAGQDALVAAVAAANPRTVAVVNTGGPVLLPWRGQVAALLWVGLPGQSGDHALAEVLTGRREPAGRLPFTLPADTADLPVGRAHAVDGLLAYDEGADGIGYRGYHANGATPAFAFGHGLGWATWRYHRAHARWRGDGAVVTVEVDHSGTRAASEVVQCYLQAPGDEAPRLAGFSRIALPAGGRATVDIDLSPTDLARFDPAQDAWRTLPGPLELTVGSASDDPRVTAALPQR